MQHLDEGTIHSWLDGALSPEEAARVEAHVKECPQCAAAVAEARGFIAASSRILTALDNAPRGVIPAVAPRKRVDPLVWRIAATVMIVAAGTLVVVRERGGNEAGGGRREAGGGQTQERAAAASAPTTIAVDAASPPRVSGAEGSPAGTREQGNAKVELSKKVAPSPSRPNVAARGNALPEIASERADRSQALPGAIGSAGVQGSAAPVAPVTGLSLSRARAMDAAAVSEPLKEIATPQRIGAKVTLYEVTPGDTVTLVESTPLRLRGAMSGVAAAPTAQMTGKSAAAQSKARTEVAVAAAAPDTQAAARVLSAPLAPAPAMIGQPGMGVALHTISWTDTATGNTLTLTGRMSEARLQEVRIRIDRERAAAAAKKSP